MIIKRHLSTYPDSFGVLSEVWFQSYEAAFRLTEMLPDAEYIGMLVWPAPVGTIPVTDAALRHRKRS